jgi:DNA gyrase subunit A
MSVVAATTRGQVAVITSSGQVVPLEVVDLPSLPDTADSPSLKATVGLREFLHLEADTTIAGVAAFGGTVVLATAGGKVKRVTVEATAKTVISLDAKDHVVAAVQCADDDDLVLVSSAGQLLRTAMKGVPVQGAGARGVAGMKLKDSARVVAAGTAQSAALVVTVAGTGSAASSVKVTPLAQFPQTGRDGVGVRCHRLLSAEAALLTAVVADTPLACSPAGKPLPLPEIDNRRDASGTPSPAAKLLLGSAAAPPANVDGTLFS